MYLTKKTWNSNNKLQKFFAISLFVLLIACTFQTAFANSKVDSLLEKRNQLFLHYQDFRQTDETVVKQDSMFYWVDSILEADNSLLSELSLAIERLNEQEWKLNSAQARLETRESDFRIMESFLIYLLFGSCFFVIMFFVVLTVYLVKTKTYKGLGKEIQKLRQTAENYKQEGLKSKTEIEQLKEKNKAISREMFLLEKSLQEQTVVQPLIRPANESELLELKAMLTVLESRNARLEKELIMAQKGEGSNNERILAEALEKEKALHERVREELMHLRQQYYELKTKAGME